MFFEQHRPIGGKPKPQYKSAIYFHSDAQKRAAEAALAAFSARHGGVKVSEGVSGTALAAFSARHGGVKMSEGVREYVRQVKTEFSSHGQ